MSDTPPAQAQAQDPPPAQTQAQAQDPPPAQTQQDPPPEAQAAQASPLDRVSRAFEGFTGSVQTLEDARAEAVTRGATTEQVRQRLAQARAREEEQLAQAEVRETEAAGAVDSMRRSAVGSTDALISALQDFRASL